ncbi:MAG: hypothetical protein ACRC42_02525, partial [Mycoplasma sp.]
MKGNPPNHSPTTPQSSISFFIDLKIKKNIPQSLAYNGLINEGMTCYMNSMIQSLNYIGWFKQLIFNTPFDSTENSLSYSLQRLFYDLSFERGSISTEKLIRSFGWSRDEILVQHDVQEFNMMWSDLMEKKFKGTKSESLFKFLFEGKISNEINCVDYTYTSKKEEKFNDIQLNVKNCKNIYDSLNKYTEEEWLDGEDKYWVEGHGKEKAKKSWKFIALPPVLIFQWKRFEYNPKMEQMDKINDRYEFDSKLCWNKYIENNTENLDYELLSIVVHKGNVYSGHYYAYIRPDIIHNENEWYIFNDEYVSKADWYEVFDMNYGGNYTLYKNKSDTIISEIPLKSDTSAYILIYIQKKFIHEVLKPITKDDIPNEILKHIIKDKKHEKRTRQWQERRLKYMDIYLLSKNILNQYEGLGISKGNTNWYENIYWQLCKKKEYNNYISIPKRLSFSEFTIIIQNI